MYTYLDVKSNLVGNTGYLLNVRLIYMHEDTHTHLRRRGRKKGVHNVRTSAELKAQHTLQNVCWPFAFKRRISVAKERERLRAKGNRQERERERNVPRQQMNVLIVRA